MDPRTDAKDALRGHLSSLLAKPARGTTVLTDGEVPDLETVAKPYEMSMARCYGRIVVQFTIDLIAELLNSRAGVPLCHRRRAG